jgi:acetyl esterase/lipase
MKETIARSLAGLAPETPVSAEGIAAVRAIYAPFHEREPYAGVTVVRECAYGPHERQRLDVFPPAGNSAARPVLLFVHGGGFVGGERHTPGSPYYDNVGVWAARNGFVGVTISYRLAPQHPFPAGPEDVGGAVRWVRAKIAAYGGDPAAIVLLGQSAGASHVAAYGARDDRDEHVRAIALMSGVYDFVRFEDAPNVRAYVGSDARTKVAASSIAGLVASALPLLVCISEFDMPAFHRQAWLLAEALFERNGRCPNFLYLPRHNHLSQISHLNAAGVEDDLLAGRLADFVRSATPARA